MNDREIEQRAAAVGQALAAANLRLATAESCTGGWVGQALTSVAGSSGWYDGGWISYSNAAKQAMLGVEADTLARDGAVSEATVCAMVAGALASGRAQVALAVSGVAGPGGGSAAKPVGTVCFAWGRAGAPPQARTLHLPGDREAVRRASVIAALDGVLRLLQAGAT